MRWAALAMVLIGCGSGGEAQDVLAGTRWSTPIAGFNCTEGIGFEQNNVYEDVIVCSLTDGSTGGQLIGGTYTVHGDALNLFAANASCAAADVPPVVSFTFLRSGDTLTVSNSAGLIAYQRLPPGGGSGAITYGCFDSAGNFTPMAIHPL